MMLDLTDQIPELSKLAYTDIIKYNILINCVYTC